MVKMISDNPKRCVKGSQQERRTMFSFHFPRSGEVAILYVIEVLSVSTFIHMLDRKCHIM